MLRLALLAGCAALQHKYGRETYGARVTRGAADLPPLLLIPPVGVGIDRQFYARFQDVWAGGDTHAPDLLGTGDATPKPRRFYKPEVWAGQLDAYVREVIGEPCVLVSQGGLLPVALEMWRLGGTDTVRGVACLSPPPLSFVASEGAAQCPDPRRPMMIYAQVLRPTAARRRCPAPPGASSASPGRCRPRPSAICSSAGSAGKRASAYSLLPIRTCSRAHRTMPG